MAVARSVSPMPSPSAIWAIAPLTTAPAALPTKAPTMPPQKRSGTKIVKCQIATPIVNQTSAAISTSSRGRRQRALAVPPVLLAPPLAAAAGLLLADPAQRRGARLTELRPVLLGALHAVAAALGGAVSAGGLAVAAIGSAVARRAHGSRRLCRLWCRRWRHRPRGLGNYPGNLRPARRRRGGDWRLGLDGLGCLALAGDHVVLGEGRDVPQLLLDAFAPSPVGRLAFLPMREHG